MTSPEPPGFFIPGPVMIQGPSLVDRLDALAPADAVLADHQHLDHLGGTVPGFNDGCCATGPPTAILAALRRYRTTGGLGSAP